MSFRSSIHGQNWIGILASLQLRLAGIFSWKRLYDHGGIPASIKCDFSTEGDIRYRIELYKSKPVTKRFWFNANDENDML